MTIQELKEKIDTKTLNYVLLSIITAGIYPILWLVKNMESIEDIFKTEKSDKNYILWLAICIGLGGSLASTDIFVIEMIAGLLSLASWVLYIIWALKIKKALLEYTLTECKINYNMNAIYTVLFTTYYINYCINELNETMEKEKFLNTNSNTPDN